MNAKINPGTILISKPFIEDRRFDKSIIFIVEHNKNGTIGFILNKQSPFQISDFSKDIINKNINIKIGGPVEKNNLFYIHKHPEIINDSFEIKNTSPNEISDSINKLEEQMYIYAKETEYEKAAFCRDQIKNLKWQLVNS